MEKEVFAPLVPVTNKENKHLKRKTSEVLFVLAMLLFPILQFVIFWIIPNIDSILIAFQTESSESFTLINFENFFMYLKNPDFAERARELTNAIRNSLIYFAVNIFFCTPLVVFFSYVLFRKVPFHGVFKVVFYLPSIIGGTVMALIYYQLFTAKGPLFNLLCDWGLISDYLKTMTLFEAPETAFLMVLIYSIWTCVGINMIMFYGAMKRIPNEIFESAELDGVGFFRQFINIVVPLIWPTISTLVVFSLSGLFVTYGPIMILAPSNKDATMIGWYIFSRVEDAANQDINYAAAVGLLFTVIGLPFVLIVRKLLTKIGDDVEY